MRKNPHGWMLAAVLLLVAAGLLAGHSHQTAAVPPEEPAQETAQAESAAEAEEVENNESDI